MQKIADELGAAYPDLQWRVSESGQQVTAYDAARERNVVVMRTAMGGFLAMLRFDNEPWVSSDFNESLFRSAGHDGYGDTAGEAMAAAIAGLDGRWEGAEVNKAWWIARLTERRDYLARELEDTESTLSALTEEVRDANG